MKRTVFTAFFYVCIAVLCFGQAAFADSGRLYIVGMGTVPDLLTIRGAKAIEESQVVMLESARDKDAWKEYIGHREVWVLPGYAWRYFGLDPENASDPELKAKVMESDRARKEIVDRIIQIVREGKTVSLLQWGDPMMFGATYYLEMMPDDIESEIIPGVGAFQAASAAVKMSPPYGWDTNSVILTAGDWPGRADPNETLMAHQTSMIFYTMAIDYPDLFRDLKRQYPEDTPVAAVCWAGDRIKQRIIRSTVGRFLAEVQYEEFPVHMLMVGKFLTSGQARKNAHVKSGHSLE